jgi:signal transduction histidine kinase
MQPSVTDILIRVAAAAGTAASPADLFAAALEALADATGVERASILLFDADGVLRFKAWRGLSAEYRRAVEGHTPWTHRGPVPDPILIADARDDAALAPYRDALQRERIRALAFIPVVSRMGVIGKFMLYRDRPYAFTDDEVGAALAIAYQIGFAVDRLRTESDLADALRQEANVRDRLTLLTTGSERLLTALAPESIVSEVLALAREVVAADGYAVWRRYGERWRVEASFGLSEAFTSEEVADTGSVSFEAPIVAEDAPRTAPLAYRREAYAREGIESLVSIPLLVRGVPAGSIVFYYRAPHHPSDLEIRVASALGYLTAAAVVNAELYREQQLLRRDAELARLRATFLAEASAVLSSLDYEENLRKIAQLVVPRLADWCAVDLLRAERELARVAVAHADPDKVAFARELQAKYPVRLDAPRGVGAVLRSGAPELYPEISDEMLVAAAEDPDHLRILRGIGFVSAMIIPLRGAASTFGVITFVSTAPDRRYGDADVQFATELTRRAALAIENARLYQTAQEANRVKDEFLATLSHELRTPLNVILGRARMLQANAGERQHADTIERNAATLARLVDDLLDLSRITVGQMRIEMQPVRVDAILDTTIHGVLPAAQAKGIEITQAIDPALPEISADPTRLQQIIWNLLSNAVKFTPAGGHVSAALTCDEAHVILTVTDTGDGLDPSFLPHAFEMFRQAEPTATRHHGGLGLGLSIVRRLVELHGGHVSAASPGLGRGATFTVRLPHAPAASAAADAPARPARVAPPALVEQNRIGANGEATATG